MATKHTTTFNPGDLVQLKSGGPAMTISEITENDYKGTTGYWCEWFKGATKERAHFQHDTLQTYTPPKKA